MAVLTGPGKPNSDWSGGSQHRVVLTVGQTNYSTSTSISWHAKGQCYKGYGSSARLEVNRTRNGGGAAVRTAGSSTLPGYPNSGYNVWYDVGTPTLEEQTETVSRRTYAQSIKIVAKFRETDGAAFSEVSHTFTIPALDSYTYSFNSNGGTACSSVTHWFNQATGLPTPTRTGYVFNGWVYNGTNYGTSCNYNASVTFVASWSPISVTATIHCNNGQGDQELTKTYDKAMSLPNLTRANHSLLGFTKSPNGSGALYTGSYSTNELSNFDLYAQWHLDVVYPDVKIIEVMRCDSAGNRNNQGTDWRCDFEFRKYLQVDGVDYKGNYRFEYTVKDKKGNQIQMGSKTVSGTTKSFFIHDPSVPLDPTKTYLVDFIIYEAGHTSYWINRFNNRISPAGSPIDFYKVADGSVKVGIGVKAGETIDSAQLRVEGGIELNGVDIVDLLKKLCRATGETDPFK